MDDIGDLAELQAVVNDEVIAKLVADRWFLEHLNAVLRSRVLRDLRLQVEVRSRRYPSVREVGRTYDDSECSVDRLAATLPHVTGVCTAIHQKIWELLLDQNARFRQLAINLCAEGGTIPVTMHFSDGKLTATVG